MKTVDELIAADIAKYGELDPLTEAALRQSYEYDLAHPDEVEAPSETLMELGQRLNDERKKKYNKS
jgi:hypothetical protein